MPRRTKFFVVLTALLAILSAGSASAIFLPCEDVCAQGTPGHRNCSYFGEGSCEALPNPCYISCDLYQTCMNGGFLEGEGTTEALSAEPRLAAPLGAGTEAWIEQLAGGFYGPCLLFLAPDQPEADGADQDSPRSPADTLELESADR